MQGKARQDVRPRYTTRKITKVATFSPKNGMIQFLEITSGPRLEMPRGKVRGQQ